MSIVSEIHQLTQCLADIQQRTLPYAKRVFGLDLVVREGCSQLGQLRRNFPDIITDRHHKVQQCLLGPE
ncbi:MULTISPECIES: hypothetical protein [Mesorhizobium]|uniref:hypothetical protein n=1 Tax=Mesorhizobium TaxID=68287 RepID=UPI0012EBF0F6|nr:MULTISPECIES: hypothetical protein [Mesorhizobium]WJI38373.1 hypothetical protein NL534_31970 [Mesorhizobium opportunistum]